MYVLKSLLTHSSYHYHSMMMHHYVMIMIMLMICIMYHHRRCKLHTEHSWRWSCCSRISIVTIPETPEARQCHQCQLWPGLRCVGQSEARMLTPDQSEGSILTYSRVTINTRHEWHLSIKYEALVNNYHTWHRTAYIVRCICRCQQCNVSLCNKSVVMRSWFYYY